MAEKGPLSGTVTNAGALSKNTVGTANVAGTRFANISNPYASLPRDRTFWDKLVNWFGARSGYDKAQEQYNLAGAEYNAQLEQLASEEKYNSPSEQAKRLIDAGINPAETGAVTSESASEFDNQQQSPNISVGSDFGDVVSSFGSTVLSALSGTMAIMKDFQSLKQLQIANDHGDLELATGMMNFLNQSNPLFKQYYSGEDNVPGFNESKFINSFFKSKRNAKRFSLLRSNAENSLLGMTNEYKSFDDFYKSAESYAGSIAQPYMSGFYPGSSIYSLASAMKPLKDAIYEMNMAQYEAVKKAQKFESKKTDYNESVLDKLDPSLEALDITSGHQANISENEARKALAPIKIDTGKIYSHMLKALNKLGDEGDIGASLLGMLLGSKFLGANTFGPLTQGYNAVKGIAHSIVKN